MASKPDRLLEPGHEAEWAKINEEEARQEAEFAASLSMDERVTFGQRLSQQAVSLDLENLERVNGELPKDPIPGLDS
jgi:hypothetical protein